ncbi:tRNA-modifying protein YgfZ [Candidatus Annandia adelgestsuga]|uniref:tRNA-modifying protein YgfZ n=1 Tax=Candidatus Annandia adelgestsuga TaxID=1302411 RepID=A0A3Q9CKS1_9ENTR|nr:tRNA-modifying protein YgfZ [Candidatus Annandia adelgestsuga]AZP36272.1 tRNA-modifying protein YgfZ [Candidatus Annandia adelgestsuga]
MKKNNYYNNKILFSKKYYKNWMYLQDWGLIHVYGIDSKKYLQNQLTLDINKLKDNFSLCAHCNYKGKVISSLRLFKYKTNHYILMERKNIIKYHLKILKKYSIFLKVNIVIDYNNIIFGFIGKKISYLLNIFFKKLPSSNKVLIINKKYKIIKLNEKIMRFIIIVLKKKSYKIKNYIINKFNYIKNNNQWLSLDIKTGIPNIDIIHSKKFFPQSLNLNNFNGISFNKGCYNGQEMVTKIHFLKKNKKSLFFLKGMSKNINNKNNYLEFRIKKKWKIIGSILFIIKLKNNIIWIQAILNNKLNNKNIIRIYNNNYCFFKIEKKFN